MGIHLFTERGSDLGLLLAVYEEMKQGPLADGADYSVKELKESLKRE